MTKFRAGDIVIALNSKDCAHNPRVEGQEYLVLATHICKNCGDEWICITENSFRHAKRMKCSECGSTSMASNNPWVSTKHFALVEKEESKDVLMIKLKNAISTENYEEAAILRDKINSI